MFQLENIDLKRGGMLEWGMPFRLRHFMLGKYLAINTEIRFEKSSQLIIYLEDKPTPETLFQFLPVPSMNTDAVSVKYVTKDAFLKMKTAGQGLRHEWIHIEEKKLRINDIKEED